VRKTKTSAEQRALILNFLLEKINALPLKDIISYNNDKTIQVAGKSLTPEQAIMLRESAIALKNSWFYRVMKEQIAFEATKMGINNSLDMGGVLFAKAAIWIQQQEINLIKDLTEINIKEDN
jgi:hypothetical protein